MQFSDKNKTNQKLLMVIVGVILIRETVVYFANESLSDACFRVDILGFWFVCQVWEFEKETKNNIKARKKKS